MLWEVHAAPRCVTIFQIFLKIGLEAAEEKKKRWICAFLRPPLPPQHRDQTGLEILFLAFYALSTPNEMGQSQISGGTGQAWLSSRCSQLSHSGNHETKPSGCSTTSSRRTQHLLPSSGADLASEQFSLVPFYQGCRYSCFSEGCCGTDRAEQGCP